MNITWKKQPVTKLEITVTDDDHTCVFEKTVKDSLFDRDSDYIESYIKNVAHKYYRNWLGMQPVKRK